MYDTCTKKDPAPLCQNLTTAAIDLWVKDGVSYSNILRFAFFINFPLYFFLSGNNPSAWEWLDVDGYW